MTVSAETLQKLHRIHRQRSDLMSRIQRGPKQIEARQASVKAIEAEAIEIQEKKIKTRKAADEKQLQLRGREERVKDLQGKLNSCNSNKEYQTLKEQIAADEQANSVLADEIFELLEKMDQIDTEIEKSNTTLAAAKADLQKTEARINEEREKLENELSRVNDDLGTVEATLSGDFMSEYERMAKARGPDALAAVEEDCCGNCHQMLSPQTMNNLMMSKPTFCSSCASLLYLPESRTP